MTVTEAIAYTLEIYVEKGWMTAKEAQRIKREDSIMFWGLFITLLLGITFFVVSGIQ